MIKTNYARFAERKILNNFLHVIEKEHCGRRVGKLMKK